MSGKTPPLRFFHMDLITNTHFFYLIYGCLALAWIVSFRLERSRIGRAWMAMREDELFVAAKELQAPYELVKQVAAEGKLPVVNFVAGGISTPADAALVMQLGAEGVFVGSGIFKSGDPAKRAAAIVKATTHVTAAKIIAEVSRGLGAPMRGIAMEAIPAQERMAGRGW